MCQQTEQRDAGRVATHTHTYTTTAATGTLAHART